MKGNPVILVADDQPQNIELLEAHLVPQGYEVVKAASGEEALEKLSNNQIDLVLLDVMMPRMSGIEVLEKLRADKKTRLIPVVMVTVLKETEDRVKALEAGCDDFITKPFDKHELLARVKSLLRIKFLHDEADEAREYAESIVNTVREPLIALDQDLRVVTASRSFYEVFKVNPKETVGQLIYDLGDKQWDIPLLRYLLETILPQKTTFDNYEVEHEFSAIGRRIMLLNARQIQRASGKERIILLAIEDITERKRLEDLLAESEMQYRRLFETASDGIVLLEKNEGHIVRANPAAGGMLGYSEEECTGKKLQDIGVSLDMSDFPAIMQALNKNGILNYEDVPVKTKSGQYLETDIYMVDRAKLAQCNIRDVTERKRAEHALHENMERLDLALRSAGMGVWHWEITENKRYFDDQVCHLLGINPATFTGAAEEFYGVVHPDDREMLKAALVRTVEKDVLYEPEYRAVWPNGSIHDITARGRLVCDDEGRPIRINGIIWDITERKRAEETLKAERQRLHNVLDAMPIMVCLLTPDYHVPFANRAFREKFGESHGRRCYEYCFGKKEPCDFCETYLVLKTGTPHRWEVKNPDGASVFDVYAFPFTDVDGSPMILEVDVDITERKRAEEEKLKLKEQLLHSQKMEAVGTLAGGIAHDFNNILNVIMGYGSMVMDRIGDDQLSKDQMNEVLSAAERAANLTKRLLVFSRKQAVEVKPININELILGLQKMLVRIIRENIELDVDLTDRPVIVLADAGQIEQVLMNLAANARDAMPEGGSLTISTSLDEIDDEYVAAYGYGKPGRYARITVTDTGQGMDAETQKKIFEPFFTTKGVGEGTGLGLAISYGIIKQHNGYIKVYSEPGQGTLFKIYLPLREGGTAPDAKAEVAVAVKGGNETILVAEDDASLRKLTRIMLESFGYSVISAEDGEDSIIKFMENRERISLVLLDMIMPKKNGKEVSEAIRKVSPRIKILFASGYTMDIIKTKELTESDFDFIHKPFQQKDLLIKVREILDR